MSMNLNMLSISLLIACVLTLSLSGWLVYKLIDQSVTLDHHTQHTKLIQEQKDLLLKVANAISNNTSEAQIREILETLSKQTSSFEKGEGHLVVNQVSFFFQDGILTKISTSN